MHGLKRSSFADGNDACTRQAPLSDGSNGRISGRGSATVCCLCAAGQNALYARAETTFRVGGRQIAICITSVAKYARAPRAGSTDGPFGYIKHRHFLPRSEAKKYCTRRNGKGRCHGRIRTPSTRRAGVPSNYHHLVPVGKAFSRSRSRGRGICRRMQRGSQTIFIGCSLA